MSKKQKKTEILRGRLRGSSMSLQERRDVTLSELISDQMLWTMNIRGIKVHLLICVWCSTHITETEKCKNESRIHFRDLNPVFSNNVLCTGQNNTSDFQSWDFCWCLCKLTCPGSSRYSSFCFPSSPGSHWWSALSWAAAAGSSA